MHHSWDARAGLPTPAMSESNLSFSPDVDDTNVDSITPVIPPACLIEDFPLTGMAHAVVKMVRVCLCLCVLSINKDVQHLHYNVYARSCALQGLQGTFYDNAVAHIFIIHRIYIMYIPVPWAFA